jgi:hypothetical protein
VRGAGEARDLLADLLDAARDAQRVAAGALVQLGLVVEVVDRPQVLRVRARRRPGERGAQGGDRGGKDRRGPRQAGS